MTDADLMRALHDCYTPRDPRNIVGAGLVRSATLTHDTDAIGLVTRYVAHIVLTAPGDDDVTAMLTAQIENRLLGMEPISRVEIQVRPALFSIL